LYPVFQHSFFKRGALMGTYRVVVADDHALFREGLKRVLEEDPDVEIVGEANDGMELLALLPQLTPDLILLDISMPNLRGIEALPEIKRMHPHAKILILTMHREYLYETIAAGADGYFLKSETDTVLFTAMEKVRTGGVFVPAGLSEQPAVDWREISRVLQKPPLTSRETEILKLIAEGKSNREIADVLFISAHTVKRHRTNVMEKLNLKKTADLVKYALQKGYI
jgi:DNA-binding NarL/FixJ family response regulator